MKTHTPQELTAMMRKPVNKRNSAKVWAKGARRTKAANTRPPPSRGGYRL